MAMKRLHVILGRWSTVSRGASMSLSGEEVRISSCDGFDPFSSMFCSSWAFSTGALAVPSVSGFVVSMIEVLQGVAGGGKRRGELNEGGQATLHSLYPRGCVCGGEKCRLLLLSAGASSTTRQNGPHIRGLMPPQLLILRSTRGGILTR